MRHKRANERVVERVHMHLHDKRDFPQAKLDRKENARFLWNEQGDLYFLYHNFDENSVQSN